MSSTLQLVRAEEILTPDPLLAKPITRLLVVKPLLPSYEDAIKASKAILLLKSPFVEFCRRGEAFNSGGFFPGKCLDLQEPIFDHLH